MTIQMTAQTHQALMNFAFDQICDPSDWKAPIDCLVLWELANLYMQAITYMTATNPTCVREGGFARLTSPGYRMGPAGP